MGPLTVISITNACATRLFGAPLDSIARGTEGGALSGTARFIDRPAPFPSYNVVGIIRGSDAALKNTYVAVGAHHDHIGMGQPVDHDSIRAFNSIVRPRGADDPPPRAVTDSQWKLINTLLDSLHKANGRRVRTAGWMGVGVLPAVGAGCATLVPTVTTTAPSSNTSSAILNFELE